MLYGIRATDQVRLAAEGYRVRTLIAYGSYWYPWFVRRIAEKPIANTLLALRNLVLDDRRPSLELRPITMDDLPLYEALPDRSADDVGARRPAGARGSCPTSSAAIVDDVQDGTVWYDVIVEDGADVGTVCVWDRRRGGASTEIGWMVLPEHQGRGLASAAVEEVLRRAREEPRWDAHRRPSRRDEWRVERDLPQGRVHQARRARRRLRGRTLRCAHWRVDVS